MAPLRPIDDDTVNQPDEDDGLLFDAELEPADPAELLDVVND